MNGGSGPYKACRFLRECNKNFQIHICQLPKHTSVYGSGQQRVAENSALFGQIKDHNSGRKQRKLDK